MVENDYRLTVISAEIERFLRTRYELPYNLVLELEELVKEAWSSSMLKSERRKCIGAVRMYVGVSNSSGDGT